MRVPFTQQQFLDVFGAYNSTTWPVVIALWLVTLAFGVRFVRGRPGSVALSALAAVHWAWSGLVYHALFFTDVNPRLKLRSYDVWGEREANTAKTVRIVVTAADKRQNWQK